MKSWSMKNQSLFVLLKSGRSPGDGAPARLVPASLVALVALVMAVACGPSGSGGKDATPPAECEAFDFDCKDGQQCIDSDLVCDGNQDCDTGADEEDCGGCDVGWMACDNGDCVLAAFVCDGVFNCADHSDEVGCPGP